MTLLTSGSSWYHWKNDAALAVQFWVALRTGSLSAASVTAGMFWMVPPPQLMVPE